MWTSPRSVDPKSDPEPLRGPALLYLNVRLRAANGWTVFRMDTLSPKITQPITWWTVQPQARYRWRYPERKVSSTERPTTAGAITEMMKGVARDAALTYPSQPALCSSRPSLDGCWLCTSALS